MASLPKRRDILESKASAAVDDRYFLDRKTKLTAHVVAHYRMRNSAVFVDVCADAQMGSLLLRHVEGGSRIWA
jgi:hypothetical protein